MSKKSSTRAARVQAEKLMRDIRRAKRKHPPAEDKIRIVQKGRRDAIAKSLDDALSKKFSETGERRLAGDTGLPATSDEIKALRLQGMISPVGLQPREMHFQNVALFTIPVSQLLRQPPGYRLQSLTNGSRQSSSQGRGILTSANK